MSGWTIGSIGGISLVVSPLFAVVAIWFFVWMRRGLKEGSEAAPMGYVLLGAGLASMVVLVGHEVAHAAMAISLGLKVPRIVLTILGAYTEIPGLAEVPFLVLFLVGLVGPAYNLASILPFRWFSRMVRHRWLSRVLREIAKLSAFLGFLNLFPWRPLDGGKVLLALWQWGGVDPASQLVYYVDLAAGALFFMFILFNRPAFLERIFRRFLAWAGSSGPDSP